MATRTIGKVIHITVTNGTAGEVVKVTNLTTGGTVSGKIDSNKQVALNSAESGVEWANGNVVQAEINGRINGVQTGTITSGGVKITLGASADTSTKGVSM